MTLFALPGTDLAGDNSIPIYPAGQPYYTAADLDILGNGIYAMPSAYGRPALSRLGMPRLTYAEDYNWRNDIADNMGAVADGNPVFNEDGTSILSSLGGLIGMGVREWRRSEELGIQADLERRRIAASAQNPFGSNMGGMLLLIGGAALLIMLAKR